MARKNILDTVSEVSKTSREKANEKKVVWIADDMLVDHPDNDEDISYTEDIESGIKLQGFESELIVTDYGMPEGKYMIVSGHRRRAAGRKCGYSQFPCIIKHYDNEAMVFNALLMYNAARNTEQDPLLFAKRYRQHMKALEMLGFKGSKREEVARRLGLSVKQADKYNTFNRMIDGLWVFVREGKGAMEGLCTLATETPEAQQDILQLLNREYDISGRLNVSAEKEIIQNYRDNKFSADKDIADEVTTEPAQIEKRKEATDKVIISDTADCWEDEVNPFEQPKKEKKPSKYELYEIYEGLEDISDVMPYREGGDELYNLTMTIRHGLYSRNVIDNIRYIKEASRQAFQIENQKQDNNYRKFIYMDFIRTMEILEELYIKYGVK